MSLNVSRLNLSNLFCAIQINIKTTYFLFFIFFSVNKMKLVASQIIINLAFGASMQIWQL